MYDWTSDMGKIGKRAELEQTTRDAVTAACLFMDSLVDTKPEDRPRFNGTPGIVKPGNAIAMDMVEKIWSAIPEETGGSDRQSIIATAVNCAFIVNGAGGGEAGWKVLANAIAGRQKFTSHRMKLTPPQP